MTELYRAGIVEAVALELDADRGQCVPRHREIGRRVADRVLGARDVVHRDVKPELALDLGIWIDDSPATVLQAGYLARLTGLPLGHIAVMAEGSGDGLDVRWTQRQLRELAASTPGFRRILTLWPEPDADYLIELDDRLPGLLEALGSDVVELDLEGHWKSHKVRGFRSLREAGTALRGVVRTHAREVEVTTFPAHLEANARGAFTGEDRLLLQSYAVSEARGEKRAPDGRYGPERRAFEDIVQARAKGEPGVEVAVGLAAWQQSGWPGEPEEAMAAALASAQRAGVGMVRWWSSKHVIGARANSYAAKAIEAAGA